MNKKLLAAAVASAVAVPGVVAADASFYGSLKPRIQVQDSDITFKDGASRIGWKSSTDMGNGNSVSGKVELGLDMSDGHINTGCLLYTSPSPRDGLLSRMPSSA